MTSMQIVKCTCVHETQDELSGKGNRAANPMRTGQLKCTVCGATHGSSSVTSATKVKAKETAPEPVKKAPEKKAPDKKVAGKKADKKTADKKKSVKGGKR